MAAGHLLPAVSPTMRWMDLDEQVRLSQTAEPTSLSPDIGCLGQKMSNERACPARHVRCAILCEKQNVIFTMEARAKTVTADLAHRRIGCNGNSKTQAKGWLVLVCYDGEDESLYLRH